MEGIFRRCKGAKLGEPKTAQVDNTTVYRHKHGKTKRTRPEHNTLGGFLGTGGGNRTRTPSLAMDFESTSSAIPTSRLSIDAFYLTKIEDRLQLFFCLF